MSEGYYWTMLGLGTLILAIVVFAAWALGGFVIGVIAMIFFITGQLVG